MQIKVKLARESGTTSVDLQITFEASTTVGALAYYLSESDPIFDRSGIRSPTISFVGPNAYPIAPSLTINESGIRSGSEIKVVNFDAGYEHDDSGSYAAIVKVEAGPDAGKEFKVRFGSSTIGRDRQCEIRLSDVAVSRLHAKINVGDVIEMVDLGSANGIMLGDDLVERVIVRKGERVVLGDSVLAVTSIASSPSYRSESLRVEFNRPPRLSSSYEGAEFATPEPPERSRSQRFPIIPLFMPLILGVVIYVSTKSLTSLIFVGLSPVMMLGNALEGGRSRKKEFEEALKLFRSDISDLVSEAEKAALLERSRRCEESPSTAECIDAAKNMSPLMWSRTPSLEDFLSIRLGLGRQTSRNSFKIVSGKRNDRAIWKELLDAIEPFVTIDGVPVIGKFNDDGAIGVCGPSSILYDYLRSLLLQVTILHSPAEVTISACVAGTNISEWDWLKWMPHCDAPNSPFSNSGLASNVGACEILISDLERLIEERSQDSSKSNGGVKSPYPAIVMVVEDQAPFDRSRVIRLIERGGDYGIFVLWSSNDLARLPAVCRTFVELSPQQMGSWVGHVRSGDSIKPITVDVIKNEDAQAISRSLSAFIDISSSDNTDDALPRSVNFLEVTNLDIAKSPEAVIDRWIESRSIIRGPRAPGAEGRRSGSLRAVIGQSNLGPYTVDLRSQGPHALVGGTTGSGKSEMLQSWILGMATAHSPQRVTFLLVDYKGGSAFSDCLDLPHTVGLVTDLSPHLVRRALISLSAELQRREMLLHAHKKKDLIEFEMTGSPLVPPSLVIVVDEFAALVQEVPEFVDGVINVAQRGRSLGLHLILATQRPAGVIKENLRANTNLRLALRMADESDSTDVVGTPQAAAFDPSIPGRGILRSGPNQLVHFQAAYVGGWTGERKVGEDIKVQEFGFGPSKNWELPQKEDLFRDPGPTDIKRIVTNLREASRVAGIEPPEKPWLPELATLYDLSKLPNARTDASLVFGVVDDPMTQSQPAIAFNPDKDGNILVVGTGGSGKSTFLRTLAISAGFTSRGGPCHVYGIDFGARGLSMIEEMPHVGSVISGADHESIARLIEMLRSEIDERSVRFAKFNAGTITDYRRIVNDSHDPRILVVIDGMAAFRSAYEGTEFNRWFDMLIRIAAEGRPVGIHLAISADRISAVPSSLASHIQRRIVLRLADTNDYSVMSMPSDVLSANSPSGRGFSDGSELQIAILGGSKDVSDQAKEIRKFAKAMRSVGVEEARPVERLSSKVSLLELPILVDDLPTIGIQSTSLGPVGFNCYGCFVVLGPPGSGRTTTLWTLVNSVSRSRPQSTYIYFGNSRSPLVQWSGWTECHTSPGEIARRAAELKILLQADESKYSDIVLVLESVADFVGSECDFQLQELLKKLLSLGQLVIAEGDVSVMVNPHPLIALTRQGRNGIILQPDQMDANLLRATFPRIRKSDFPQGRGYLISRGGAPQIVQVAFSDISDIK